MTFGSLFAGIGGFDLGFERAGLTPKWQVEIDPFCRAVLAKHWPQVTRYEDVREVHAAGVCGVGELCVRCLPAVDVLCGGFPCQDISDAGRRAGIAGARSGLWSEFARLIREVRPRYVVVENVAALLGRGLGRVLGDLAACGYDAEWDCIPAASVGAPHRRDRIWLVAYPASQRNRESQQRVSIPGECLPGLKEGSTDARGRREVAADSNGGRLQERHGDALQTTPDRYTSRLNVDGLRHALADTNKARCAHVFGSEARAELARFRTSSCAGWWEFEPNVGRVAHGIPAELDFVREVIGDEGNYQEANTEARQLVWQILRAMWEYRSLATTSPDVYRERLRGLVPGMPQERAHQGWLLGPRLEGDEGLRGLLQTVHAASFNEAQDMLPGVLERIGSKKRPKEMGNRIDRLRGLGNAVVPQITEWIGRRLMEAA